MAQPSGDRSEAPTQHRKQKALRDGQVAFSAELTGGILILAMAGFFLFSGSWFFRSLAEVIHGNLRDFDTTLSRPDHTLYRLNQGVLWVGRACLALMGPLFFLTVVAGALQARFNISLKPLEWSWGKLSPARGMKRLFSTRSMNRTALSILKAAAIVGITTWVTWQHFDLLAVSGLGAFPSLVALGAGMLLKIALGTGLALVVVGVIDLAFQHWKQHQELMMTKQEVRDEQKDIDGDPQLRARIRKIQGEMAKKRITDEVPRATVVITNPTHFAVALRYIPGESSAPVVVAKGADHLAFRIIDMAKQHQVAVVERKPVARFLYANVKVGQEIPLELYQAVAEILNYIRDVSASRQVPASRYRSPGDPRAA